MKYPEKSIDIETLLNKVYDIGYKDGVKNNKPFDPMNLLLAKEYISDGDHTFEELYFHRMILFSAIVNSNPEKSFKSKLHDDGSYIEGYFLVGIETPDGNFTYHYKNEYFDLFKCKELERGPQWDGHKSKDVVRLLNIQRD